MAKLGIIVPYRDREEHLSRFIPEIQSHLEKTSIDDYEVFVINQDNDLPFNRGWLCNIGFTLAKNAKCDYVCFHDVDMLPEDDSCDYSWVDRPTQLSTRLSNNKYKLPYPEYFGGVTLFPVQHFELINGYSNEYWGWGFEDDDLLYRCRTAGLPLEEDIVSSSHLTNPYVRSMDFRKGDYIDIKISPLWQKILTRGSYSFEVWTRPSDLIQIDNQKHYDEFHIFAQPGYHTGLCWTSAQQYKYGVWNTDHDEYRVVSHKMSEQWNHIIVCVDAPTKTLQMFVNGVEVQNSPTSYFGHLREIKGDRFYIGCTDPKSIRDNNWFEGQIAQFSMWRRTIDRRAVRQLFNEGVPWDVTKPKNEYSFVEDLFCSYDFENIKNERVIDGSKYNHNGDIVGAIRKKQEIVLGEEKSLPTRRDGKFTCLEHEENGWSKAKFKDWRSRDNQIRYFNFVRTGIDDYKEDGLSTLKYTIKSQESQAKINFVSIDNE